MAHMADIKIHPECLKLMKDTEEGQAAWLKQTMSDIREQGQKVMLEKLSGYELPYDGVISEIEVPYKTDDTEIIPCTVYRPKPAGENQPLVVYLHGGGLMFGSRLSYDSACKKISRSASCVVVNVEYCLAPEYKFPVQIDDAVQVTKWVIKNKAKIGGTPASKVCVAGDSAGGYLAAAVTHEVQVDFQVLVYPMMTVFGEYNSPSVMKYKSGPLLTLEVMQLIDHHYLPENVDMMHPRLNPILRPSFVALPPALVLLAEHDLLLDSAKEYAQKLKDNGVPVEIHTYQDAVHGFFGCVASCPMLCEDSFGKIGDFIKRMAKT